MRILSQLVLWISFLIVGAAAAPLELPEASSVLKYRVELGDSWWLVVGREGRVACGYGASGGDAIFTSVGSDQVELFDKLYRSSISIAAKTGYLRFEDTEVGSYLSTTNKKSAGPFIGVLTPGLKEFIAQTLAAYPYPRVEYLTNKYPIFSPAMVRAGEVALKKQQENGDGRPGGGKPVIEIPLDGNTPSVPTPIAQVLPTTMKSTPPTAEPTQEGSPGVATGASMGFRGWLVIGLLAARQKSSLALNRCLLC